jgi:hypothetical protein
LLEAMPMPRVRTEEVIRHFHENGLKLLFHEPGNVRDLLTFRDPDRAGRIDFDRMAIDPTSYIAADYRHLAADLVLRLPYRTRVGGRLRTLTLYLLLEHQSEPDELMVLRVLDYLVQIYKAQIRTWVKDHGGSRADLRLQPVLPLVLYTGERNWPAMKSLAELVEGGEEFAEVLPPLQPLFFNLATIPAVELETSAGYLGWVLELIQRRHAPMEDLRALVARVVGHLEEMAEAERDRWLLLLSYLTALVYHDRREPERESLRERIVESVQTDPRRREVEIMTRTIADALRDEGRKKERVQSRQELLLRLLRGKFGRLPRAVEQTIRATDIISRLDAWFDAGITAQALDDVGIPPSEGR